MTDPPPTPPDSPAWSKLLAEQRASRGYSVRKAARLAGMSDSFWGMAERGYKPVRGKEPRPMRPARRTLLAMTEALRLSSDTTNAILTSAGYRPVTVGEAPDPRAEVDLSGLTQGDIVLLSALARHLRDLRRNGGSHTMRSESSHGRYSQAKEGT